MLIPVLGDHTFTSEVALPPPGARSDSAIYGPSPALTAGWTWFVEVSDSQPRNSAAETLVEPTDTAVAVPAADSVSDRLKAMSDTLRVVADLQVGDWGYDADYLAPTHPAYESTWELVAAAVTQCALPFPAVSAGPLGDGGLSLQWGGQERYVRLLMPPDPKDAYLYSQGPGVHFLDAARPELLARRIVWLLEG